jgi:hypothetical protein
MSIYGLDMYAIVSKIYCKHEWITDEEGAGAATVPAPQREMKLGSSTKS